MNMRLKLKYIAVIIAAIAGILFLVAFIMWLIGAVIIWAINAIGFSFEYSILKAFAIGVLASVVGSILKR